MSAVLLPSFGNPVAIREAAIGNAAFDRAVKLGYGKFTAQAMARKAKSCAMASESPAEVAFRVVPPKSLSATMWSRGPYGGGQAA